MNRHSARISLTFQSDQRKSKEKGKNTQGLQLIDSEILCTQLLSSLSDGKSVKICRYDGNFVTAVRWSQHASEVSHPCIITEACAQVYKTYQAHIFRMHKIFTVKKLCTHVKTTNPKQ
jgi:hypothetical protein